MQPAQLVDVIERLVRLDAHLEAALAEVEQRVAALHVTWTGDAAQAQRTAHTEWHRGAEQMRAALMRMRAIAVIAHANYAAAAAANVRMWSVFR